MLYPLKLVPVYKDYIWGGRDLEMLGKKLPEGITAESWEVSGHPDGISVVADGEFKGITLPDLMERFGRDMVGTALPERDTRKFPLLVKLIDAHDRLSVQVHPDDEYAFTNENGEYGKNEMWYVISAKPGSKIVYDVVPGMTRELFGEAIKNGNVEKCLKSVDVFPDDVVNIPAGLVHAIGGGLIVAEIQQNSNATYRVYDYERTDKDGNKRPLHVEKALSVISFDTEKRRGKVKGLNVKLGQNSSKTYLIANKYFSVEKYAVNGSIVENTDGERFHIYVFMEGMAEIAFDGGIVTALRGESVLIPASVREYRMTGFFKALKAYVPDIEKNVVNKLMDFGYVLEQILEQIEGIG